MITILFNPLTLFKQLFKIPFPFNLTDCQFFCTFVASLELHIYHISRKPEAQGSEHP